MRLSGYTTVEMVMAGEWERAAAQSFSAVPIKEESGIGFLCGRIFVLVYFSPACSLLGLIPHQSSGLDSTLPLNTHTSTVS